MRHLFLTVQTDNVGQAVSVRVRAPGTDGFQAALFEEEALDDGHSVETVGYLAIDAPADGGWLDLDEASTPTWCAAATPTTAGPPRSANGSRGWAPF